MKLKQIFAAALLLCSAGAWAQTDVTSTYLTNADFSQTTALTGTYLYGYGKDGSPYGFQTVDGWTSVVTAGDNSNTSYPNSGTAAGVFSYGSSTQLKGNSKAAPTTNPNGEASGNCFGFFGVWSCGGYYYQEVTFPAGKYTITVPMYNQSGTQANTTYTGFFPTSGTNQTVAVNPTVGQWVNQSVTFTLADETAGQIRIGYQSTGGGSGANPMLFIDCVKIEFTAVVVKDVLQTAITAATNANAKLSSSDLAAAITTAQGVYNDENATQEQVNNAAATLNAAVELAMSAAGDVTAMFITNADMSSTDGWTQYVSDQFRDFGKYPIGGSEMVRFAAPTADDNHLTTEYAFGFECRWDPNWASYYQETPALPAGVYTLTFDVENVNSGTTSANYENLCYLQAGSNKVTDSATEWMQGKTSWTTHTIHITLNEAAPLKISLGYGSGGNNFHANNTPALYVSHLKLNYQSFLAGAKAAWDEAVAAANQAKIDCPNVTGEELTALNAELAKAEPTTVAGYNEATAALISATATFTAAKDAYDAFVLASSEETILLAYAADTKRAAVDEAKNVAATSAADAETKTAAIVTALRTYYESHALAEKVDGAVNCAEAIAGADPDTNTGWTSGIGTDWRSQEIYTQGNGEQGGRYYDGGWSTSASVNINMSRSISLPAGTYLLTVTARGSESLTSYAMSVAGESVNLPGNGSGANTGVFGHGWDDVSVEFTSDGHPVTLTIAATSTEYQQWISFNRFRLVRLSLNEGAYADASDYAALNSAIEAAEAKTLGFEDGQYAPYNNVAALEALTAAKAIDQTATLTNLKSDVQTLTSTLGNWTANDGDVDAIYNGMFDSTVEGDWGLTGWKRTNGWGQQQTGLSGNYATAYYNQPGSLQYGNHGVYAMPLAANTAYQLTFSYRSHENNSNNGVTVSVLNGEDGMPAATFTKNGSKTDWADATAYFTTGAAGNYVLTLANSGNTWMTNVSLVKFDLAASIDLNEEDGLYRDFDRTYAKTVTVDRTIKNGFNTVCLPFDLTAEQVAATFGENAKVYTFEDVPDGTNSTINFNTNPENTIEANVPVLIGEATACTETKTFNNVMFKSGEAKVAGTNFDFVGVYATEAIADGDYFVGNGAIYKSEGSTNIKAFRAYLKAKSADVKAVKMLIDGIATGIEAINGATAAEDNAPVFNIAGQRVNKAQKGIYIQNGKKYIVK